MKQAVPPELVIIPVGPILTFLNGIRALVGLLITKQMFRNSQASPQRAEGPGNGLLWGRRWQWADKVSHR